MTKDEKLKRIEDIEKELAELKESIKEEDENNQSCWRPKCEERYYYINTYGEAVFIRWINNFTDIERLAIGNVFRTKEEADFEVERLKVIHELRQYAEPRDIKLDGIKEYFFIAYNFNEDDIDITFSRWWKSSVIYFSSEDRAWKAIKAVGKERIKKYYLEVE